MNPINPLSNPVSQDLQQHPAAIPPTDPNSCPFLTLPDNAIAQILFLARNPLTRGVCYQFTRIEDTAMGTMFPTEGDTLQGIRRKRQKEVSEIDQNLRLVPEPARKRFKTAHKSFLSTKENAEAEKAEVEKAGMDCVGDYPLTASLLSDNQLPTYLPIDKLRSATDDWFHEHSNTCTELKFSYPKFLPPELEHMPCLRKVTILEANFSELPQWFYGLPITDLKIRSSPSSLISAKIAEMKSLEILTVSFCDLTSIPRELALLPNLKKADFRNNPIEKESLPEELKPLVANETLLLGYRYDKDHCVIL